MKFNIVQYLINQDYFYKVEMFKIPYNYSDFLSLLKDSPTIDFCKVQ